LNLEAGAADSVGAGSAPREPVIDAHVHVWDPGRADYEWLPEFPDLDRSFDLDDVGEEHRAAGVGPVVLVQAADNLEDTDNMLRTARRHPRVAGVVGWVPITDPIAAGSALDNWSAEPIVGGAPLGPPRP
jgi:L-fuconolactonase